MPNTKSAEKRMRNSLRKQLHNRSVVSHLRKLEKNYRDLAKAGKKEDAAKVLRDVVSAFDKAVKSGVVHKATASRKKSRHTLALARVK
jgi:small subunit ribosomal protein S20